MTEMATSPSPEEEPKTPALAFSLQEGEALLKLCRKHWWFLWPSLIALIVAAIAPVVLLFWLFDLVGAYDGVGKQVSWGLTALWLLYWGVRIFLTWYQYHNDVWVITNQRIVDSFKKNPFNLRVSSADLVNVQDISVERLGILQTTLDFGDIVCQTSGAKDVFRIHGVADPRATQALIDKERDRERLRTRGV